MNLKQKPQLIDFEVNIKLKLAMLWIATTFCYVYGDYFELYTPDKVEGLLNGNNGLESPVILFIASIVMTIPPVMILLSLVLKPRLNRVFNIIFGSLFTIMMVLIAVSSLTPWYTFYVYLAIVESILTSIIVWQAIKWPRSTTMKQ